MAPPTFPPELHSLIIRLATYSPVYFDASPDPRSWPEDYQPYNGNYATKKALTLVSHQFLSLTLPYLYEVVEVHKSSSMQRLADVLGTTSLGSTTNGWSPRKIKYLFVSVLGVSGEKWKFDAFTNLGRALPRCGSLQGFGFYFPQWVDQVGSELCNWWTSIPKGVRFFDWQGSVTSFSFARTVGSISESLIALRFSMVHRNNTSGSFVSLPKLTHLSMLGNGVGIDVLRNWSMPSLTHLYVDDLTSDEHLRGIEYLGDSLRSVTLGPKVSPVLLSQLATVSRNLEEYTYHCVSETSGLWASIRSHQSLQSIVVVIQRATQPPMSTFSEHLGPLTKAHFPNLRRIGIVGFVPPWSFEQEVTALLDKLLDVWHASGIDVKFLETTDNASCFMPG